MKVMAVTGEVTNMKVTERVEQGSGRPGRTRVASPEGNPGEGSQRRGPRDAVTGQNGARPDRMAPRHGPAPPDRMGRLYTAVWLVVRFWLWFFFKPVDVRHPERVPASGPVLLCKGYSCELLDLDEHGTTRAA
jgi:hypothetical protein